MTTTTITTTNIYAENEDPFSSNDKIVLKPTNFVDPIIDSLNKFNERKDNLFSDDESEDDDEMMKEVRLLSELGLICVPIPPGKKGPHNKGWNSVTETPFEKFKPEINSFGLLCSEQTGIFLFDIDDIKLWNKILKDIGNENDFINVPKVLTPSGGLHYYFKHDDNIDQHQDAICLVDKDGKVLESKVDTRAHGKGQGISPPSIYSAGGKAEKEQFEGTKYKWENHIKNYIKNMPECPEWLKDLLTKKKKIQLNESGKIVYYVDQPINKTKPVKNLSEIPSEKQPENHTLDEMTNLVNGLNKERFSGYDNWCKLLWAVARWQSDNGIDDYETIEMLDKYSQLCEGYKSTDDVIEKYKEGLKNVTTPITIGTLIKWYSEDNPGKSFSNKIKNTFSKANDIPIIEPNKEQFIPSDKLFDKSDPYTWSDYETVLESKTWIWDDLIKYMRENTYRVLANIRTGKAFYLKKDRLDDVFSSVIDQFTGCGNISIRYCISNSDKASKADKEIKTIKMSELMMESKVLKKYTCMDIYPDATMCPSNVYNLWAGINAKEVETVDENLIGDILHILKSVWANDDEKLYKYLLAWFRFTIFHPAEKTTTALYLYSEEGAGKNFITDFITDYVLGSQVSRVYNGLDELIEKHNTKKVSQKLCIINEMASTKEQFLSNFDKMKSIISDNTMTVNPKGKTTFEVKNYSNVIMTTNHLNALYLPSKNQRRYTCIAVANTYVGDSHKKWWKEVRTRSLNQNVGDHFYTYLKNLNEDDLPDIHQPYRTNLEKEINEISLNSTDSFIEYYLSENEEITETWITATSLYEIYSNWCKVNGEKNIHSSKMFGSIARTKINNKKVKSIMYSNKKIGHVEV